ncbi:hypothetical protein F2P81_008523 [Scophthalmus maximus]|uniref:Uncharacterized protein n=1 Tax=Scophthalmus maximus TaxID=52904 RepID=A0A6A4T7H6_SCOMX|nr:hypothetical protein F2P81_008523 [Scophthalmus maximus]
MHSAEAELHSRGCPGNTFTGDSFTIEGKILFGPQGDDGVKAAKRSPQTEIQTAVHQIYQQLSVTLSTAAQQAPHSLKFAVQLLRHISTLIIISSLVDRQIHFNGERPDLHLLIDCSVVVAEHLRKSSSSLPPVQFLVTSQSLFWLALVTLQSHVRPKFERLLVIHGFRQRSESVASVVSTHDISTWSRDLEADVVQLQHVSTGNRTFSILKCKQTDTQVGGASRVPSAERLDISWFREETD